MGVLGGLKNCVAFLTIIPVGMSQEGMAEAASYMPLFPVIGAFVGLLAGAFVWALELALPSNVAGIIGIGFILLLNGVQHMDGLLDFGDGLMCHGSPARRLRVMRDPQTGAGGFSLGAVVLVGTGLVIASLPSALLLPSLVVSEAAAKFSMVYEAWGSKSAHKGMSTMFVDSMHDNHGIAKLGISLAILLLVSFPLLPQLSFIVDLAAILVSAVLIAIAKKLFGGITGDVMGATNEITRFVSLLIILGASHWT